MATSQFGGSIVSGWLSDRFHRPLVTLVSNLISLSAVVSLAILLAFRGPDSDLAEHCIVRSVWAFAGV